MYRIDEVSLSSSRKSLTQRLEGLHHAILERVPSVDRIGCALYDHKTDLLKTFINSTHHGHGMSGYQYKLSDSQSLSQLAANRTCRVIEDIASEIRPGNTHSDWLLRQNYQSSFTMPMVIGDTFIGFLFFDSTEKKRFSDAVQRDLLLYSNLIVMAIAAEISAVTSLIATAQAARDFADLRDFETGMHLDRMAQLSRLIAREVADQFALSDEHIEHIYLFAPLHDIGKIGISDKILLKPGRFTSAERAIMETHVEKGVEILCRVLSNYHINTLSDSEIMLNIVACHHEFMDGSGYPNGLIGEAIPIEARIVTVADIFDALTSKRPYKNAWDIAQALEELRHMTEEGKLDARCVDVLLRNPEEAQRIVDKLRD